MVEDVVSILVATLKHCIEACKQATQSKDGESIDSNHPVCRLFYLRHLQFGIATLIHDDLCVSSSVDGYNLA